MSGTLNDDDPRNIGILKSNDVSELDCTKMGANTVLKARNEWEEKLHSTEPYIMANADVFQVHSVGFVRDKVSLSIAQRNIIGITALILSLELEVTVSRDEKGILVPIKSQVRTILSK